MGLFSAKHDPRVVERFEQIIEEGKNLDEIEFLDRLNIIVQMVEVDDSYSTNQKLKIYELLSQISNCFPEERAKYARKLVKVLK